MSLFRVTRESHVMVSTQLLTYGTFLPFHPSPQVS
jgi:hypothetical protein